MLKRPRVLQYLLTRLCPIALVTFVLLISFISIIKSSAMEVYAATSSNLNFQGRLLNSSGNTVTDGYYNLEFKLYSTASGGASLWSEAYYDSNGATAGNDNRTRVVNGYFSVNLGSQTAFPSTISWDQDHWLTMNVGGSTQTSTPSWDGEMTPRIKLTAVPHAFSSSQVAKTDGSNNRGTLSFDTVATSPAITLPDSSGVVCLQQSADCINQDYSFNWTAGHTWNLSETEGLAINSSVSGTNNGQAQTITITNSSTAGNQYGLYIDNAASTGSTEALLVLDNSDTDTAVSAAIKLINAGGGFTNLFDIEGTLISATEFTVLDGGISETEVTGEIEAVTAGNGLTGGGTADSVTLDIGAGNGISVAADTISVIYGSAANTAVQGNITVVCPSGTGDLSGGGTSITLGTGGTCSSITISEAPVFDTSVTTPLLTNSGLLTVQTQATIGADDIVFQTAGTEKLRLLENGQLVFGTDTNLYRSAADTLQTDDAFTAAGLLTGQAGANISSGGLRIAGSQTSFLTPVGSSIPTYINIPLTTPGDYGQLIAMGLPSNAQATSRAITVLDARTVAHQPSIAVLSPNEADIFGLSWDGSNSTAYLKTLGGNIGIRSNTTDIMTLLSGGNVGIGATPSYKLDVAGDINTTGVYRVNGTAGLASLSCLAGQYIDSATVAGGIITGGTCTTANLSDARLKENVVSLDDSILDKIKNVRTVNFDFKCDDPALKAQFNFDCTRQTGVIAQELAQVFPELVYQGEDGYYRVKYDALSIYNLKAVTEIARSIDSKGNGNFNTLTIKGDIVAGTIRADKIEGLDYVGRFESLEERVSTVEKQYSQSKTSQQQVDLDNLKVANFTASGDTNLGGLAVFKNRATFDKITKFKNQTNFGMKATFIDGVEISGLSDVERLTVRTSLITEDSLQVNGLATFKAMARFEKDVLFDSEINVLGYANVQELTVNLDLIVRGSLQLDGPATFKEVVRFEKDAEFQGNVAVKGQATFNGDTAGYVTIRAGDDVIEVKFANPKQRPPIIALSLGDGKFAQYSYRNVTEEGFEIILSKPTDEDLNFSWIAIQAEEVARKDE